LKEEACTFDDTDVELADYEEDDDIDLEIVKLELDSSEVGTEKADGTTKVWHCS